MNSAPSKLYGHNLVNALYVMKSLLETCEREQKPDGVLERIYEQADQALRMAKRLSMVSALKNGDEKSARGRASLSQAWRNTLALLRHERAGLKEIEIIDRIPADFPLIQCRPRDLREIFFHLASNAVEAMAGEGKLILRSQLSFSTQEVPYATIQMADTGPGIPESLLPNLFLPFASTKSFRKGNGLGLYLTHQLVRRNSGRITVSSFPAAGATFTLEFPLAK